MSIRRMIHDGGCCGFWQLQNSVLQLGSHDWSYLESACNNTHQGSFLFRMPAINSRKDIPELLEELSRRRFWTLHTELSGGQIWFHRKRRSMFGRKTFHDSFDEAVQDSGHFKELVIRSPEQLTYSEENGLALQGIMRGGTRSLSRFQLPAGKVKEIILNNAQQYTMGAAMAKLGWTHQTTVRSRTSSQHLALWTLGIGPNAEVREG
jgi:hypothetical protein